MKILNKIVIGAIGFAMAGSFVSCDKELYKEEQYQHGAYLLSDENGIFGYEYELGEMAEGYLSVCGFGSTELDRDIIVTLEPDNEILAAYNKKNFDQDKEKFAKELKPLSYEIRNMSIILKAGEEKPYSMLPIEVNPDGLSPDSTYFISLRIKSVSDYSFNPNKRSVLYQVYPKNKYATTKKSSNYTMVGTRTKDGINFDPINATKILKPLTKNSVRLVPDTEGDPKTIANIEKLCMIATVCEETIIDEKGIECNVVTLSSYKELLIEAIPGKTSFYNPETQSFHLVYKYDKGGTWLTIDEVITEAN